jgi:hypothetical protein
LRKNRFIRGRIRRQKPLVEMLKRKEDFWTLSRTAEVDDTRSFWELFFKHVSVHMNELIRC